ncbi:MAG: DeoR/GlpR family DNA-binding transcription regulator [Miniphocaeibacter sp.]|uniref:DeoR/GlpR family DNA-binding transcription regulator n=1 Tax=Miniphocaeibacter sp. TaxID=3100973 RepID=UPI0017D455B7|nr:DeoR/GlpR transcriptional regulator [Gallicola sp.]
MLKIERQNYIVKMLNANNIVKVTQISEKLKVSEMTIRRDLKEMEEEGILVRIHGGAKLSEDKNTSKSELSHKVKQNINKELKTDIAKKIASQIKDNETIFLGPGTTIEQSYEFINCNFARIITNSYYLFEKFKDDNRFELILIGGKYRSRTGAFVGSISIDMISKINVQKSFIGVNGIYNNIVTNSNEEEGLLQKYILDKAEIKYIVADNTKLDLKDFYEFYDLYDIDYLITDNHISEDLLKKYKSITKII